jgi:hypothetical protein
MYTDIGLPAFYAVVNFITLSATRIFVGGENRGLEEGDPPLVQFVVDQIAVQIGDDQGQQAWWLGRVKENLLPHVEGKG